MENYDFKKSDLGHFLKSTPSSFLYQCISNALELNFALFWTFRFLDVLASLIMFLYAANWLQ